MNGFSRKIVSGKRMSEIDRVSINEYGISGSILMEAAGEKIFSFLVSNHILNRDKSIFIICGRGDNGGDGLVLSRYLLENGFKVRIFIVEKEKGLSSTSLEKLEILESIGYSISSLTKENIDEFSNALESCNVIIDALFGTGLNKIVFGFFKDVISVINNAGKFVISIDIPSGLDSEKGYIGGIAVMADICCTIGLVKYGLLRESSIDYLKELIQIKLPFPAKLLFDNGILAEYISKTNPPFLFIKRDNRGYKNQFGNILVIGGNNGMLGAAIMSALSALKTGAGLVTIASDNAQYIKGIVPEIMTHRIGADFNSFISDKFNIIVFGPGLGIKKIDLYSDILLYILKNFTGKVIIDAHGILILREVYEKHKEIFNRDFIERIVITPHVGEASHLLGISKQEILNDRIGVALKISQMFNTVAILKGHRTITASGKNFTINIGGNPGMATAGSGDVLSGIIATISNNMGMYDAARYGVFLHSLAGDIAVKENCIESLIASDIIENIPRAIKYLHSTYRKDEEISFYKKIF